MQLVKHRFEQHIINPETEILIIGTFNPDTPENIADFFYSRQRNFLWTLVPASFGDSNLKGSSKAEKLAYIYQRKIDFIDLIAEVDVDKPDNYADSYIDKKVTRWNDIISRMDKLPYLNKVCFTRRTFSGIPNMQSKIESISDFCKQKGINFQYLTTPARFYRADKQEEWARFFTAYIGDKYPLQNQIETNMTKAELFLFSDKNLSNVISERHAGKGGVYKIIAVRDGRTIPVNRFLGTDTEGVLYIGKATSFIKRVIDLKKSIAPDYKGTAHICGRRYKSNPNIAKFFPYEILHVQFIESQDPPKLERQLLSEYANTFGEVPPLNAI